MVEKLRIRNFRGIEDLEIELSPGLTVLVGRNAFGKTTVLDALSFALGAWTSAMKEVADSVDVDDRATRLVTSRENGVASRRQAFPLRVEANFSIGNRRGYWAREVSHPGAVPYTEGSQMVVDAENASRIRPPSETLTPSDTLPVLAYYRTDRLFGGAVSPAPHTSMVPSLRLLGYEHAFHAGLSDRGLQTWLEWREQVLVQQLGRARQDGRSLSEVRSPEIEAVSAAVSACLEHARRILYSFGSLEVEVEMTDGTSMPFRSLSDGQRNLAALAADIARRSLQLNPHLGANAPRESSGWILIDEVDLHLHPAWQRRVVGDLQRAFPKMNFVVTTHSPQVLSSVASESIRLIVRDGAGHRAITPPVSIRGRDTNAILEDLLGVSSRPAEFKARLEHAARLIEDEELEAARREVSALEQDLHDDPDVMGLRWELERAEDAAHPQGK